MFSYQYNIPINSVIEAYKQGMFPMAETYSSKEIYWIEPKKRGVFLFNNIKIPKKFKKFLKKNNFQIAIDNNFEQVINNCAKLNSSRKDTWINSTIKKIYIEMHNNGFAHSVECYLNKELVGGLYGIKIGRIFFGESMFSFVSNASKVTLVHLLERLKIGGFKILDTQFINEQFKSIIEKNISKEANFYFYSQKGFLPHHLYPLKKSII